MAAVTASVRPNAGYLDLGFGLISLDVAADATLDEYTDITTGAGRNDLPTLASDSCRIGRIAVQYIYNPRVNISERGPYFKVADARRIQVRYRVSSIGKMKNSEDLR